MNRLSFLSVTLLASFAGACSSGPAPHRPDAGAGLDARALEPVGSTCYSPDACASGVCLRVFDEYDFGYCSGPCADDADCGGELACGIGPDGLRACVPDACGSSSSDHYVCIDDQSVACEQIDGDAFCQVCGCDDPSLRCSLSGCVPLSDVGGECTRDSDCRTNNCSRTEFVCRVPVGAACDDTNCDRCMVHEDSGWSFCSRTCESEDECNGALCIGRVETGYTCRPRCDASCPARCSPISGGGLYCDCFQCDIQSPATRGLYSLCGADETCASGACLGLGLCTTSCSSDAACGDLGRCATVPCAPGQSTSCGNVCVQRCDSSIPCRDGSCITFDAPSGGTVLGCEPRSAYRGECWNDRHCLTGRCDGRVCILAEGRENGEPCTGPDVCQSNSCVGGICRGAGLIGDPCAADPDCAAGVCCAGSCRASC